MNGIKKVLGSILVVLGSSVLAWSQFDDQKFMVKDTELGLICVNSLDSSVVPEKSFEYVIEYKKLIMNEGSMGYFLINSSTKINITTFTLNFKRHSDHTQSTSYSKSDLNFLKFWDYYKQNDSLNTNFTDFNADYICNSDYCVSYGIFNENDLILYKYNPFTQIQLYQFDDDLKGCLKLDFFGDNFLLVLRRVWDKELSMDVTYLYLFDLSKSALVHRYNLGMVCDIKVLDRNILLIISDGNKNQECYNVEIGSEGLFNFVKLKGFNSQIYHIF
jgi:hypothetical protein